MKTDFGIGFHACFLDSNEKFNLYKQRYSTYFVFRKVGRIR